MNTTSTLATDTDTGTAYTLPAPTHNAELTEVGRGTPMGELMRRYWQPIGLSSYATELPREVRALGEDLILFRDKQGRPGLVHPRCVHRGSSLLYGRIDDAGIRCCYHGWAFDVQGRCTDQPCEPQNGLHRDKVRQPWYPVEERYGIVFAYMGPPDKKPLLPHYDVLEDASDGKQLFTDDGNIGSGRYFQGDVPFNWLQHFENIHDYGHFMWLHFFHSGAQFGSRYGEMDKLDFQPWQWMKNLKLRVTPRGVLNEVVQPIPDGRTLSTIVETLMPCIRAVPNPFGKLGRLDNLGFLLPVDDTNFRIFTVMRSDEDGFLRYRQRPPMPFEGDQLHPNDWEAQGSQGKITLHSAERLATSDQGVIMLRRQLKQQIDRVAAGQDPIGVAFDPAQQWVVLEAGQSLSGEARAAD